MLLFVFPFSLDSADRGFFVFTAFTACRKNLAFLLFIVGRKDWIETLLPTASVLEQRKKCLGSYAGKKRKKCG